MVSADARVSLIRAPLFLALATVIFASPLAAQPKTLYERLAYGRTIILGTCEEVGRRATVRVDEILRGDLEEPTISIAFKMMNWERTSRDRKIVFEPGVQALLLIEPAMDDRGRRKGKGLFVLEGGFDGKIDIPAEGREAFLQAVRRMIEIQSLDDQHEIWEAHRSLLREENPLLVEAGFEEVLKFRLGNESILGLLLDFVTHPRDGFRAGSIRILGQMVESSQRDGETIPEEGRIVDTLLATARGDGSPEVRAEAIRTLKLTGRGDLRRVLETVADTDPSQLVRYEAQLALLEMNGETLR